MKLKIITTVLLLTFGLSACGNQAAPVPAAVEELTAEYEADMTQLEDASQVKNTEQLEGTEQLDAIGDIEVDKGLLGVEFTVPATYVGESTQADLDAEATKKGYKSVTLNEDGSATYKMSKSQHDALMLEMKTGLNSDLSELIGSEEYPNFTDIKTNDNFTEFTITTKSTELDLAESFSVMAFYVYGGMYNIFNGTEVDEIKVTFVNDSTGEIISTSSSKDTK